MLRKLFEIFEVKRWVAFLLTVFFLMFAAYAILSAIAKIGG